MTRFLPPSFWRITVKHLFVTELFFLDMADARKMISSFAEQTAVERAVAEYSVGRSSYFIIHKKVLVK